jgi:hypothetical protein
MDEPWVILIEPQDSGAIRLRPLDRGSEVIQKGRAPEVRLDEGPRVL